MDQTISSRSHRPRTIHALQCARGFAALLVVYYHASTIAVPNLTTDWLGQTDPDQFAMRSLHLPVFGACGVDLFFVLSGYIMWTSTQPAMSTQLFYKRRIARIVPLYWLVTLVTAIMLLTVPSAFRTLRFSLPHVAASLAFVPWHNPAFSSTAPGAFTPLVIAGWTLNFEVLFYLLFGLVAPRRHRRLLTMVFIFTAFVTVVVLLRPWLAFFRFYDPFLIAEFLLGCLLAVLVERRWVSAPRTTVGILVIGTIALLLGDYVSPPTSRFFYSGLPAAAIVYGLVTLEYESLWPRMNVLERIGDASYSIYLTHIFALATMRLVWRPVASHLVTLPIQSIFALSVIATSVAIGFASFHFVERPLSNWAERRLGIRRATPSPASVAQVAVVPALALRSL